MKAGNVILFVSLLGFGTSAMAMEGISKEELQKQNAQMRAQMLQMQKMLATFEAQMTEQSAKIEQVADPKAVEKGAVRAMLEVLEIPTDDLSDDEGGLPPNYAFNYVVNKPALLERLKVLAGFPNYGNVAELNERIADLEDELGYTRERLSAEEKARRMLEEAAARDSAWRFARIQELEEEKEALVRKAQEKKQNKPQYAYN